MLNLIRRLLGICEHKNMKIIDDAPIYWRQCLDCGYTSDLQVIKKKK